MARSEKLEGLLERKHELLAELARLGPWRRGSITVQTVTTVKDGRKTRRELKPLYTYKETGQRTISRRLTDPNLVKQYREQIQRFRQFQKIQTELVTLGERLCAADATGDAQKKKDEIAISQDQEVGEVLAKIQKEVTDGKFDLEAWEQRMREVTLAAGARGLERVLAGVGCGRQEQPVICPCGTRMHSEGLANKKLFSTLGPFDLRRAYYTCPSCHHGFFPADQLLQVENTGYTPGLVRMMARAGSKTPYSEAELDLLIYAGVRVSAREIERLTLAIGTEMEQRNALERQSLIVAAGRNLDLNASPTIPILYVSFDGTGVPVRRVEVAGRRGKQPDGSARTREVKLGCVFTQTSLDDDGYPIRDPQSTTYVGAIETSDEFGSRIYAEALRRGLLQAAEVVVLCDGATANRTIYLLHFPNAVFIIDLYHAREHLSKVVELLVAPKLQLRQKERWLELLDQGKIEPLVREWRRLLPQHGPRRNAGLTEINYFVTHAAEMRYAEFRRRGFFVGSGVIEAGCKTVIGKRLKQSGMFWSVPGANSVITLRCSLYSGRYEKFWADRVAA